MLNSISVSLLRFTPSVTKTNTSFIPCRNTCNSQCSLNFEIILQQMKATTRYKFRFVDCASGYNRAKKIQLDAQLILSIFRQPVHVSGVSR